MNWKKIGLLYSSKAVHPKLMSHAANPLAVHLQGDIYRVFYSGRDHLNRSSVGYIDVDIVRKEVVYIHDKPVFEYGLEGSFYSHGVSIGNCYEVDGKRYILFMGWQIPEDGHWRGDIGRLILNEDLSLELDGDGPFISSDAIDPISLSYPWVMQVGTNEWKMWYGSTVAWDTGNGEMLHVINHATSNDGHSWNRCGLAVPYRLGEAQAFSRPTVIYSEGDGYQMWFSYRSGLGEKYRIGYASSRDDRTWQLRVSESGIDVSKSGWDSEMIEYPFVFRHLDKTYMLYNGNGYGQSGIGMAILE
ncbi:hypothetical protein ACFL4I_01350 [Pseudomonadota bacterium]